MPNLELVDVNGEISSLALGLIRRYQLDPRDSIHAATARSKNAGITVSTDDHFDRVKEIRRRAV